MKRVFLYLIVFALTLSSALPFAPMSAGAQTRVSHTIIAMTGDASPAGGVYLPSSFFAARLNARHDVVFDAAVARPFTTGRVCLVDQR
jgi:hypothetical protein